MPCPALEGLEKQSRGGEIIIPQESLSKDLQSCWDLGSHLELISWLCCSVMQVVAKPKLLHRFGVLLLSDEPRRVVHTLPVGLEGCQQG